MKDAGETGKSGAEEELRKNFQAEGLHSDETPESRKTAPTKQFPKGRIFQVNQRSAHSCLRAPFFHKQAGE